MVRLIMILIILCLPFVSKSQKWGAGGSVLYNFQTEGIGAGARASLFPNKVVSYVPQISYYFPFNKIHEYNVGMGVEYKFVRSHTLTFYALGHAAYNSWLNHESSPLSGATGSNWNLEGGIGVTTVHCLRPFVEYRYNVKFRESHLQAGLLYIFGCAGGTYQGRCPAYH